MWHRYRDNDKQNCSSKLNSDSKNDLLVVYVGQTSLGGHVHDDANMTLVLLKGHLNKIEEHKKLRICSLTIAFPENHRTQQKLQLSQV